MRRAVVLARGLGRRMRAADGAARLDSAQEEAAASGVKGMIPIGRPFLDYLLSALADAGFTRACLVIGPEHGAIREHYAQPGLLTRIGVEFAVQREPRGTADAVLAAEPVARGEPFLVCNADNYYPVPVLSALRALVSPGLAGFARDALVRESNIPPERVAQFALLSVTPDGYLTDIIEKPDPATEARLGPAAPISMNAWVFDDTIFEACRAISPSPRGEYEIQDAVRHAMRSLGVRFRVLPVSAGVLDLSRRGDVAAVAERLAGVEVHP